MNTGLKLVDTRRGGGIGGLLGGVLHLIGLQGGGHAEAGQSYIVGEKGPELFRPNVSGMIVPNGGGGGVTNNYSIDARGADPTVEFRIRRALADTEQRAVVRSVAATKELSLRTP